MKINIFGNNKLDRQGAIFLAVGFLLGTVFLVFNFFNSKPIEKKRSYRKNCRV